MLAPQSAYCMFQQIIAGTCRLHPGFGFTMEHLFKWSLIPLLFYGLTSQAAVTVTNVAPGSGARDSLFLKSDGSLWVMGWDIFGELGDGGSNNAIRPEQIVASNVTAIAAGGSHNLFIKSDGSLWAMGYNSSGQLGDGSLTSTNRPKLIVPSGVTAIAAGAGHSLFLKSDGSLWAMGGNDHGQLGDGTFNNTNRPEKIVPGGVTAIAAGYYHSLFVSTNGSLWAMGRNDNGELGDSTFGDPASNNSTNKPEQIVPSGVTAVAAGRGHSLFLKSDGSLWAMGWNQGGQLGDGSYNTSNTAEQILPGGVAAIAAGFGHSLLLKTNGSLWAVGYNAYGQLGDGTFNNTNSPEQIVAAGVTTIAAGEFRSLFTKSDGSLWATGDNTYGQLGDGFATNGIPIPEKIVPAPQPVMSIVLSTRTNLQINATCGFGDNYYLLGSTNLLLSLSQWKPLRTNSITLRGVDNYSVTLTNAVTGGGRQYYILQSQ
jgi:alpha-tubulin suppressor-like RCC1 family protein